MQQQNYYYTPQIPRYNSQQALNIQPASMLRGRPVSSLEEVRAAAVDFDGVVTFFPDLAKGFIYTKQCNLDGTSTTNVYKLIPTPTEVTTSSENFVTRDEFNKALAAIKDAFNSKTKIETAQGGQTSNTQKTEMNSSSQQPLQEFNFN